MNAFGLTGNIGCGKSTLAALFAQYPDVLILDCDHIAKEIISGDGYWQEITEVLEADVFPKGKVDLQAIAAIIFNDAAKKRAFEALIHPLVWLAVEEKVDTEGVGKICIVESAIIYETGSEHMFTGIIVAACDSEEQFRRLKQNRGMGETNIRARLTQQLSSPEKETRADFVIHTDCEMEELKGRVENLHTVLKQRKGN